MIRRSSRSTLFPYTTLFRSWALRMMDSILTLENSAEALSVRYCRGRGGSLLQYLTDRDRKSTRLNSSHEWISYAVFCLKKKKDPEGRHQVGGRGRDRG